MYRGQQCAFDRGKSAGRPCPGLVGSPNTINCPERLLMHKPRRIPIAASFAGLLVLAALFADFLSPNPPASQNLDQFFHPPSRVHIFDSRSGLKLRFFIYQTELTDPLNVI